MTRLIMAFAIAAVFANGASAQELLGSWKLISWQTKFDGGDVVEPYTGSLAE